MLDELKTNPWATADRLRANRDAAEYKHLVLGLITVKPISDTFVATGAEPTARLSNPVGPYYCGHAAPESIEPELEDRNDYAEVNAFWVPEAGQLCLPGAKAMPEEACA